MQLPEQSLQRRWHKMKVEDLDVLRPEPRMVRLGGKDIDVSFIPCGITFDIDRIIQQLNGIDQKSIMDGGESTRKALDLSIDLCVTFCSHKYPEMDREWFDSNVDSIQIERFVNSVREALLRAYAGIPVDGTPKNPKAPRRKSQ